LITVTTPEASYFPIASQLQAAMVNVWNDRFKPPPRCSAALVGPGLAAADIPEELKMFTRRLWRDYDLPVIVDASALDWLPLQPVPKNAIRVMTPHPGEAARLLGCNVEQIQADRVAGLRKLSQRFGHCWVVLKGHQTLIGRSEGRVLINSSGNPHLAQGGSGDVLAGFVSGLLTQPDLQSDAAQTLAYAVWQHGAAADALQEKCRNWTVEDLAAAIGGTGQTNLRSAAD